MPSGPTRRRLRAAMPGIDVNIEDSINGYGLIGATVAVSAWGVSSVIAKEVDMEGLAVAAYRFGTYGLVVAPLMAVRRHRVSWNVMRASMVPGVGLEPTHPRRDRGV